MNESNAAWREAGEAAPRARLHVYDEESGGERLGVYSSTVEDTTFYVDDTGVVRVAPSDCVTVRP